MNKAPIDIIGNIFSFLPRADGVVSSMVWPEMTKILGGRQLGLRDMASHRTLISMFIEVIGTDAMTMAAASYGSPECLSICLDEMVLNDNTALNLLMAILGGSPDAMFVDQNQILRGVIKHRAEKRENATDKLRCLMLRYPLGDLRDRSRALAPLAAIGGCTSSTISLLESWGIYPLGQLEHTRATTLMLAEAVGNSWIFPVSGAGVIGAIIGDHADAIPDHIYRLNHEAIIGNAMIRGAAPKVVARALMLGDDDDDDDDDPMIGTKDDLGARGYLVSRERYEGEYTITDIIGTLGGTFSIISRDGLSWVKLLPVPNHDYAYILTTWDDAEGCSMPPSPPFLSNHRIHPGRGTFLALSCVNEGTYSALRRHGIQVHPRGFYCRMTEDYREMPYIVSELP